MESDLTNVKMQVNVMLPVPFVHKLDKKRGRKFRGEIIRDFLLQNEEKFFKAV